VGGEGGNRHGICLINKYFVIVTFVKIRAVKTRLYLRTSIYSSASHILCLIGVKPDVWDISKRCLNVYVMWKTVEGRLRFSYGGKLNYIYACTVKPYDISNVKNALLNSVYCNMWFTICSTFNYRRPAWNDITSYFTLVLFSTWYKLCLRWRHCSIQYCFSIVNFT